MWFWRSKETDTEPEPPVPNECIRFAKVDDTFMVFDCILNGVQTVARHERVDGKSVWFVWCVDGEPLSHEDQQRVMDMSLAAYYLDRLETATVD